MRITHRAKAAKALVYILSLSFTTEVKAFEPPELTVIADFGGEPTRPYFVAIGAAEIPETEGIQRARTTPFSIADMLPVETPSLSPGRIAHRTLSVDAPTPIQPLFIVGNDPLSRQWLSLRKETLAALGATGLAVNVQTEAELQTLIEAAGHLRIDPVPGDTLAQSLGLTHYPVLLTPSSAGIELEQ